MEKGRCGFPRSQSNTGSIGVRADGAFSEKTNTKRGEKEE